MSQGRIDFLKSSDKNVNTSAIDPMYHHPYARRDTKSNLLANSTFSPIAETNTEKTQTDKDAAPEFKIPK